MITRTYMHDRNNNINCCTKRSQQCNSSTGGGTINCGGCVLIENSVIMLYSFQFFLWGLSVYKHIISTFTERLFQTVVGVIRNGLVFAVRSTPMIALHNNLLIAFLGFLVSNSLLFPSKVDRHVVKCVFLQIFKRPAPSYITYGIVQGKDLIIRCI